MALRIIKPPKPGKMFVTLASTGYLFFSSRVVAELNLSEHKGVLLAHDERGALHLKVSYNTDPRRFPGLCTEKWGLFGYVYSGRALASPYRYRN